MNMDNEEAFAAISADRKRNLTRLEDNEKQIEVLNEVLGGIHDIVRTVIDSLEPHDEGNGYGSIPGEAIDALRFVLSVSDRGACAEIAQVDAE